MVENERDRRGRKSESDRCLQRRDHWSWMGWVIVKIH